MTLRRILFAEKSTWLIIVVGATRAEGKKCRRQVKFCYYTFEDIKQTNIRFDYID